LGWAGGDHSPLGGVIGIAYLVFPALDSSLHSRMTSAGGAGGDRFQGKV
jgi:hypothetical protein